MTFFHELKGVPLDAYNKCCEEILRRANRELGLPREEIILRDLRPEDLGLRPVWKFTVTSTLGWTALINTYTVVDNRFICISGVANVMGTPAIDEIKITRAGSVARWWNVQRVGGQDDNELHVHDPIIIDQNTTLDIDGYAAQTTAPSTAQEQLIFIGSVAEKRGMLINPIQ